MLLGLLDRAKTDQRRTQFEAELYGPEFPDGTDYLVEILHDIGPAMSGAMGLVPLTYTEMAAWCDLRRQSLSAWEVGVIRQLSIVYCNVVSERQDRD